MGIKHFIPLSIPYLKGNEEKYLRECITTGWVSSRGPFVEKFEEELSKYVGSKYAVAVSSGTSSLHTALIVLGIKENTEVIVPTVTFIASINVVKLVGAYPVFMDCDDYLNIDVEKVEEFCQKMCFFDGENLINKRTKRKIKAIIPVHIFGHPVDIEPLMKLARKYNLFVVEDAAQSLGSYYTKGKYEGKKTGTMAHIGCYSFNGNKIITTGGGGMVVTDNKKWAECAKYLINQAKDDPLYYIHNDIGYNYRMTNLQAAVGVAQLERLDKFIQTKRKNFLYYKANLEKILGLSMIEEPPYGFSNYWYYSLVLNTTGSISRDKLLKILKNSSIEARPLWKLNHTQKSYLGEQSYKIRKANMFYERVLNIPCSVGIKKFEIDKVIEVIKDAFNWS